jgi:hypothetical protein
VRNLELSNSCYGPHMALELENLYSLPLTGETRRFRLMVRLYMTSYRQEILRKEAISLFSWSIRMFLVMCVQISEK